MTIIKFTTKFKESCIIQIRLYFHSLLVAIHEAAKIVYYSVFVISGKLICTLVICVEGSIAGKGD